MTGLLTAPTVQTRSVGVLRHRDEILETTRRLATSFTAGAADRERDRRLPDLELHQLVETGLLAITAPTRFGGADVSAATLTEVVRLLATADGSIAEILHSHFVFLDALRRQGSDKQQARFFGEVMRGARFAIARTDGPVTTLTPQQSAAASFRLAGERSYLTGGLFADWLVVRASIAGTAAPEDGSPSEVLACISRHAPGVTIVDDWDGMGQRTIAAGTAKLEDVRVESDQILAYSPIFDSATTHGLRAQLLRGAVDAGTARGTIDAAFARVQEAEEFQLDISTAESLLRDAATMVDLAELDSTDEAVDSASISVAVATFACRQAADDVRCLLFELYGTCSTDGSPDISRVRRDARTPKLPDPKRRKVQHLGRWLLDGFTSPRHGQI